MTTAITTSPATLDELAVQINDGHRRATGEARSALAHAFLVGELLIEAKHCQKHGDWGLWIKDNLDFGERQAQKYLRVARRLPELPNTNADSYLTIDEACRAISGKGVDSVHFSSESVEWYTPEHIVHAVVQVLGGIDLDPCSDGDGSLVPALKRLTKNDDGFSVQWEGRVYMNPPYGRAIGDWVSRLCEQYEKGGVTEAVALLPSRTDTSWFTRISCYRRCFIRGRLKFGDNPQSAPFPSMVVYFGKRPNAFAAAFASLGDVYQRIESN